MDNFWIIGAVQAIKTLSYVYDIFTFPVYLLLQRPWTKRKASRRIKAKPVYCDDTSVVYRNIDPIGEMHATLVKENIETLEAMLRWVAQIHRDKKCLGTRQILAEEDEIQPNGRVFKKVFKVALKNTFYFILLNTLLSYFNEVTKSQYTFFS